MNEMLRSLKAEKELEALPEEEDIKVEPDKVEAGSDVTIAEEEVVKPEDADAKRPKPLPKKNRRGSKALLAEIEEAHALAEANKEKYTRLLADVDNMRARNEKENSKMFDYGASDTLEKLLPVIDNFERALASVSEEEKTPFEQGIEMIYKQFMETLEKIGVKPMDPVGKEFDPNLHNAVIHVEDESVGENIVMEEMQKGYMYKDTVLRHSMVKVAN
ncbi:MAG: nucleotide exchange factor GrpE [Eubacterium sp.]|nr:nucleotide exchange factor GrpE [Eubacterium sp.]